MNQKATPILDWGKTKFGITSHNVETCSASHYTKLRAPTYLSSRLSGLDYDTDIISRETS